MCCRLCKLCWSRVTALCRFFFIFLNLNRTLWSQLKSCGWQGVRDEEVGESFELCCVSPTGIFKWSTCRSPARCRACGLMNRLSYSHFGQSWSIFRGASPGVFPQKVKITKRMHDAQHLISNAIWDFYNWNFEGLVLGWIDGKFWSRRLLVEMKDLAALENGNERRGQNMRNMCR